jgi:hypothetical protein
MIYLDHYLVRKVIEPFLASSRNKERKKKEAKRLNFTGQILRLPDDT